MMNTSHIFWNTTYFTTDSMRNIALYGGAFDPPHIGHIRLIHSLVDVKGVDEVWLMPCGDREDKKLLLSKNKRF